MIHYEDIKSGAEVKMNDWILSALYVNTLPPDLHSKRKLSFYLC